MVGIWVSVSMVSIRSYYWSMVSISSISQGTSISDSTTGTVYNSTWVSSTSQSFSMSDKVIGLGSSYLRSFLWDTVDSDWMDSGGWVSVVRVEVSIMGYNWGYGMVGISSYYWSDFVVFALYYSNISVTGSYIDFVGQMSGFGVLYISGINRDTFVVDNWNMLGSSVVGYWSDQMPGGSYCQSAGQNYEEFHVDVYVIVLTS